MTLKQYRQDPARVAFAINLLQNPAVVELMEIMRNEHPRFYRTVVNGLPQSDHSMALGRVYGYDEYESNLLSAAMPLAPDAIPLQATFADSLEPEEKK